MGEAPTRRPDPPRGRRARPVHRAGPGAPAARPTGAAVTLRAHSGYLPSNTARKYHQCSLAVVSSGSGARVRGLAAISVATDAALPARPGCSARIVFPWGPASAAESLSVLRWGRSATRRPHDELFVRVGRLSVVRMRTLSPIFRLPSALDGGRRAGWPRSGCAIQLVALASTDNSKKREAALGLARCDPGTRGTTPGLAERRRDSRSDAGIRGATPGLAEGRRGSRGGAGTCGGAPGFAEGRV
jgi:hypothetical protein